MKEPNSQDIINSKKMIIETFFSFRKELLSNYGQVDYITKKDNSPVTSLDVKIENTLKNKLSKHFADFGFKGEETLEKKSNNGATWYVDPIDGTSSFIHGLPFCSNMASLVINNKIVASVIYHFVNDELFTALKGDGAYKDGKRISVRENALSNSYIFADSFSYINAYSFYSKEKVKFYAPMGATGYFMSRLAQGSIQGVCYLRAKIKPHDVAPGILLVNEAGGNIIQLKDESTELNLDRFIACTDNIRDITIKHLKQIKKL